MPRYKDQEWDLPAGPVGKIASWEAVKLAVLMDIRDELKRINIRLDCSETLRIPRYLRRIASNTAKPRKKK